MMNKTFEEMAVALQQNLGPALTKLRQFLEKPEVSTALTTFLNSVKKHQELSPYVSKLLDEMKKNPNLSEALETVPYVQLIKLLTNSEVRDNVSVLDLINDAYYQRTLFYNFDTINISNHFKNRRVLIEEALQLYKLGMYAGCLTLLHSQFEGIITDYLIFKGVLVKKIVNKKTNFKEVATGKNVVGLAAKIELAKNINENFKRLESFNFDNDQNIKFHNERNDILHGSNIANFNQERCFVVFIWIDSILYSIYMEEVLPTKLPSANAPT
ncbi:hypothetical protein NNO96_13915 [Acinetobacter baumannii]|uniref:hypothetical protein n=1 Tax=Acinetobacter baumannii TaxID=470 RepID=UPI0020CF4E31|nr:hypothetical protein [Acinetobacter baumannii]MCQ1073300.1 hypothetical protein [Acinetobacter baumannii]